MITDEMANFLEYLAQHDKDTKRLDEKELKKKFGEKQFDKLLSLCFYNARYAKREVKMDEGRDFNLRITIEGLKFLSEHGASKRMEKNNNTTLFLTIVLVLTTIASLFNDADIMNTLLLIILYGISVLVSVIICFNIFKRV